MAVMRPVAGVMFSDEHYNLPTLYMFITIIIHYVLMYLVVFLSYQMSYCDVFHATISAYTLMYLYLKIHGINCLDSQLVTVFTCHETLHGVSVGSSPYGIV